MDGKFTEINFTLSHSHFCCPNQPLILDWAKSSEKRGAVEADQWILSICVTTHSGDTSTCACKSLRATEVEEYNSPFLYFKARLPVKASFQLSIHDFIVLHAYSTQFSLFACIPPSILVISTVISVWQMKVGLGETIWLRLFIPINRNWTRQQVKFWNACCCMKY